MNEDIEEKTESLFETPSLEAQSRMCEAMLFASAESLTIRDMEERMPQGCNASKALEHLRALYENRGVKLVKTGGSWAFRTAPDLGFLMRQEMVERRKLSRAAIETLAIIAYHQPATRAEIESIRGVSASRGIIDQLLELEWVKFGRRKTTPGRPVTFMVTEKFLDHFGLESVMDLPGLSDLRAAGLLANQLPPNDRLRENDEESDSDQPSFFED